jgi:hypothetical protein
MSPPIAGSLSASRYRRRGIPLIRSGFSQAQTPLDPVEAVLDSIGSNRQIREIRMKTSDLYFESANALGQHFDAFARPVRGAANMAQMLQDHVFDIFAHPTIQ